MANYVQVVLRDTLKNLGKTGDLVRVRPGYARNFLLPRELAVHATEKNVARIEHDKREATARAAKVRAESEALAKTLSAVAVTIQVKTGKVKAGDGERLYGSVGNKEIAEALKKLGHEVDRRKIDTGAANNGKELGTFNATIKLSTDVSATVKVTVAKL